MAIPESERQRFLAGGGAPAGPSHATPGGVPNQLPAPPNAQGLSPEAQAFVADQGALAPQAAPPVSPAVRQVAGRSADPGLVPIRPSAPAPGGMPQPSDPIAEDARRWAQQLMRGRPGRPGRAVKVPEKDQKAGFTVAEQEPVSADTKEAAEQAYVAENEAVAAKARADTAAADAQANAQEAQNEAQRVAIEQQRVRRHFIDQKLEESRARYEERQVEAERAATEGVDPNRYFKEQGTFGSLLGVFASAMAGANAARSGGSNQYMDRLQRAIDRDIDAQKESIRGKGKIADDASRSLQEKIAFYGDPVTAEAEQRAEMMSYAAGKAKALGLRAQNEVVAANVQGLYADIEARRAQQQAAWDESERAAVQTRYQTIPEHTKVVGGTAGVRPMDPGKAYEKAAKLAKARRSIEGGESTPETQRAQTEAQVITGDGSIAWAKDKENATKIQGQIDSIGQLQSNYSELERIRQQSGTSLSPQQRARVQALQASNVLLMKEAEALGAVTEADAKMVDPFKGVGVDELFSVGSATGARLGEAARHFESRLGSARRQLYSDPKRTKPLAPRGSIPRSFRPE